jgi:hypothetical protein
MINVQTYGGVLKSLGTATRNQWGVWTYAMLEIGDAELRNVEASELMSSYLQLGLGKDVTMLLGKGGGFTGKRLMAMKYDGKIEKDRIGAYIGATVLCAIFALLLLAGGVWPLALLFGFFGVVALNNVRGVTRFS